MDIKRTECGDGKQIQVADDRNKLSAFVNTAMKFYVP